MTSPNQLLAQATAQLNAAGVDSPRVDAELLLAHVLDVPRSRLLALSAVTSEHAAAFESLVQRRANREPLQHITGRAPFRHLELHVGPGVFIPRPETELLVDAVLPALNAVERPLAVDLCSGSGALALAIADEAPGSRVVAVERSEAALQWLRRNAAGTSVEVRAGDIADRALLADLAGRADVVVCNPPYVPADVEVSDEVRADPAEAVFAGPDGMQLIPTVIAVAADLLKTGGLLAMEHDESHGAAVREAFAQDGRWREITPHRDLTDRPRYTVALKS